MQDYLKSSDIKVSTWLGNSPDLNCIENVWYVMGSKISEKEPATMVQLHENINRFFNQEIYQEYKEKLISYMPDSCKSAFKTRGGPKMH